MTTDNDYRPQYGFKSGPMWTWPVRPLVVLRFVLLGIWPPWHFVAPALAGVCWFFLTPSLESMSELKPGWVMAIWLRNAALQCLLAGSLHWWLYVRRGQGKTSKLHDDWLDAPNKRFLFDSQVRDNMFWALASGVTIWTLFESVALWLHASGRLATPGILEHPIYFVLAITTILFWTTFHFYVTHRLLHWTPLYRRVHELHHRNVTTGPWSGISMHPVEHVLYFSAIAIWWVVPVHPIVIVLTALWVGLAPAITHSGFDFLGLTNDRWIYLGDWFHQLHHKHFNVNYGNSALTPMDKVFGSWFDPSVESIREFRARSRSSVEHYD